MFLWGKRDRRSLLAGITGHPHAPGLRGGGAGGRAGGRKGALTKEPVGALLGSNRGARCSDWTNRLANNRKLTRQHFADEGAKGTRQKKAGEAVYS